MTSTTKIDKKNISIDENGMLHLTCTPEFKNDIKEMYGFDVENQKFLRHIYFNTVDGKVSFTSKR